MINRKKEKDVEILFGKPPGNWRQGCFISSTCFKANVCLPFGRSVGITYRNVRASGLLDETERNDCNFSSFFLQFNKNRHQVHNTNRSDVTSRQSTAAIQQIM